MTDPQTILASPAKRDKPSLSSDMEFIRHALDSAAIVAVTDVRGTITFVNSKFCEISGYGEAELIGSNHRMLQSGVHDKAFFRDMYRQIAQGHVWHGELCNRRKDGTPYWVDTTIVPHRNAAGKIDSYTAIRFDITARHEAEALLREAVSTDPLTGIANRRQFHAELETAIETARQGGAPLHLALLDIDMFKEINDAFGHDVGDVLLARVARRLSAITTKSRIVARLGGDEFGIVLPGIDVDIADAIVHDVLADLRRPGMLAGAMRRASVSIGIASFPEDALTQDDLFKAADMALYRAKALGRDRALHFAAQLRDAVQHKAELMHAIESGLAADQFELHYQPVVPVAPGSPISLEALLRWRHPERGLIAPGAFLADLEDPGLQAAIGQFVVERAFRDARNFIDQGLGIGHIAINVTNADFRSDDFVDLFFNLSDRLDISPGFFCIEVTEGVFLGRDFQHVEGRLRRLHAAGVEIALDDFGTGFASLTHLRRMPIDRIKIDRSFVANLPDNIEDAAIVRGVSDIAHGMGKTVTAEGVETAAQAELLARLGCDQLQGWLFAKASPPEQLCAVLAQLRPSGASRRERLSTANPHVHPDRFAPYARPA